MRGIEHTSERLAFLKALQEAHEEDEHAYPTTYCIKLFEELNAVWVEQVRESRRTLCAKLGTEKPRVEDLKLIALAPGPEGLPNFRFSRVWDLKDIAGNFQQVIVALNRLLHRQLHDATTKEKGRATVRPQGQRGRHLPGLTRRQAPPDLHSLTPLSVPTPLGRILKGEGKGEKAGGAAAKAYPAEKRLTPTEIKRSIAQAFEDPKSKTPICWDAACDIGCLRQSCPHSHEPLPPDAELDYSVATQVLRRGGLKNGPKVNPKDVDAQLRSQRPKPSQGQRQGRVAFLTIILDR